MSNRSTLRAIREFARNKWKNIINIGKREGVDPINALNKITEKYLEVMMYFYKQVKNYLQVIRKLLGEEKSLRGSVMMTNTVLWSVKQQTYKDRLKSLLVMD